MYLSGWLRKANIAYDSAKRIVELLAENDEERDKRLYVLDRTFGLRGNPPVLRSSGVGLGFRKSWKRLWVIKRGPSRS